MTGWRTTRSSRTIFLSGVVLVSSSMLACGEATLDEEVGPTFTVEVDAGIGDEGAAVAAPGVLPAGTYRTAAFRPGVTFTVGEGWSFGAESTGDVFLEVDAGSYVGVDIINGAVEGVGVYDEPVDTAPEIDPPGSYQPFPSDYEAWLRSVPELDVGLARPSSFGGATGAVVDVTFERLPPGSCQDEGTRRCFAFLRAPSGGEIVQFSAQHVEVHVLDVDGDPVLVLVYDRALAEPEIAGFLDSLSWGSR